MHESGERRDLRARLVHIHTFPNPAAPSAPYFWLTFSSLHELRHAAALPSLTSSFSTPNRAASVANEFGAKVLAQPQISCGMQRM
jgi:hypothetical protein